MHPLQRIVPRLVAPLGASLLTCLSPGPVAAQSLGPALVSFSPGVLGGNDNFAGTIGWDFRLERPYNVAALGFYDAEDPGLLSAHAVGIFHATTRELLVSGLIPAGTAAPLQNGFRWLSVPAVTLPVGSYVIAAVMPGTGAASFDPFIGLASDPLLASGVLLDGKALSGASPLGELVFPDSDEVSFAGFFGPNFAEVPGPLPLAGAATALAWSRRLRRRAHRQARR